MSNLVFSNEKIIDSYDWDNLVSEVYGKHYEFQQQNGCRSRGLFKLTIPSKNSNDEYMNDSIPEVINYEDKMGVKFDVWLSRDSKSPLNPSEKELKECPYYYGEDRDEWCSSKSNISTFWERNFYPDIYTLANDLHEKGFIEKGQYFINIDW